jgi:hypothetical protein
MMKASLIWRLREIFGLGKDERIQKTPI